MKRLAQVRNVDTLEVHYRSYSTLVLSCFLLSIHGLVLRPICKWDFECGTLDVWGCSKSTLSFSNPHIFSAMTINSDQLCDGMSTAFLWLSSYNLLSVLPLIVDRIIGVFYPHQ